MTPFPPYARVVADLLYYPSMRKRQESGHRAFTLVELLVIVAIICAMAGVGVVSVRGGQAAARVKGATRDVFAAIRHARSQALVSQKPVVVTYSTGESDGEPVAKVEMTSAKLFSAGVDRASVRTLTGEPLPSRSRAWSSVDAMDGSDADDGTLVGDVLFAPIKEEVVRGMRLKVVVGDDSSEGDGRRPRLSVFSNVDYLLGKYRESRPSDAATSGAADGEKGKKKDGDAPSSGERQEPVSVVWETNGRVEPHRVWVYADGQRPEDGLSIRIDRFGAAKVISGDGQEDED